MLPADLIQQYTLCNSLPENLVETWHRGLIQSIGKCQRPNAPNVNEGKLAKILVVVIIVPVVNRSLNKNF